MLSILDSIDMPMNSGKKAAGAQTIDAFLRYNEWVGSQWRSLARQIADQPSEVDYIFKEWTHTRIAREYLEVTKKHLNQLDD